MFSTTECMLIYYRQKDDGKNAVAAGFITGGLLAIRGGAAVAFKQAMIGGVILMIIETVGGLMQAIMARRQMEFQQEMMKQEMARMKQMALRGGDNPWQVDYNTNQAKSIDAAFDGDSTTVKDKAKTSKVEDDMMILDKAKTIRY